MTHWQAPSQARHWQAPSQARHGGSAAGGPPRLALPGLNNLKFNLNSQFMMVRKPHTQAGIKTRIHDHHDESRRPESESRSQHWPCSDAEGSRPTKEAHPRPSSIYTCTGEMVKNLMVLLVANYCSLV